MGDTDGDPELPNASSQTQPERAAWIVRPVAELEQWAQTKRGAETDAKFLEISGFNSGAEWNAENAWWDFGFDNGVFWGLHGVWVRLSFLTGNFGIGYMEDFDLNNEWDGILMEVGFV